jgi:PII-like signaling protein
MLAAELVARTRCRARGADVLRCIEGFFAIADATR